MRQRFIETGHAAWQAQARREFDSAGRNPALLVGQQRDTEVNAAMRASGAGETWQERLTEQDAVRYFLRATAPLGIAFSIVQDELDGNLFRRVVKDI